MMLGQQLDITTNKKSILLLLSQWEKSSTTVSVHQMCINFWIFPIEIKLGKGHGIIMHHVFMCVCCHPQ